MENSPAKRGRPPRNIDTKTNLRTLREARGLSQEKLAEMIGVCQSAISAAERYGTGEGIGMAKWLQVSEILDVDLRSIFTQ